MDTRTDTLHNDILVEDVMLGAVRNGSNATGGYEETGEKYLPIMILTGVFGGLFIILPFLVRRSSPNRVIIRCSIMLSLFCLWIFWVTVYIGQMNPIMGPRMHNTTVAWIAHTKGDPVKRSQAVEVQDYY